MVRAQLTSISGNCTNPSGEAVPVPLRGQGQDLAFLSRKTVLEEDFAPWSSGVSTTGTEFMSVFRSASETQHKIIYSYFFPSY